MSRQAWKWIFEMMPDAELASLAHSARVKVPGFRQITAEQMKILRPRLVTCMSAGKDLARVKKTIDDHVQNCEQCTDYRGKTQQELVQEVENGCNPIKMLSALLTSPESGQQMLGELMFDNLYASGLLTEVMTRINEICKDRVERATEQSNWAKQQEEYLKQLKKYEEKIARLEKASASITEYQTELEQKIKQLHANLEEQVEQMEEERSKWEAERTDLLRQLADKQAILDQQALLHTATEEVAADTEVDTASENTPAPSAPKMPVVLVGKPLAVESKSYEIQTVEIHQVEQALEQNLFGNADQVWVLTYEAPLGTQRKLRRSVSRERLREFQTLKELQRHIGQ